MFELLTETDFEELPEELNHRWLFLERAARARLNNELESSSELPRNWLLNHYMAIVSELAQTYGVEGVAISGEQNQDAAFQKFELAVSKARTRIWAETSSTFPFGRVALSKSTKDSILDLTAEIEKQIESLDVSDKRQRALHQLLEDFRREINQPKSRMGFALSSLAQAATVLAMTTTSVAQADLAFANILSLLGSEQAAAVGSDAVLIDSEKLLLLEGPPAKQIEGPTTESV